MNAVDVALLILLAAALAAIVMLSVQVRRSSDHATVAYRERAAAIASAQEREQLAIQRQEALDALGESTSDALLLLDKSRQVVWANAAAWNLFSRGDPALGQPFIALVRDHELNQAVGDALAGHRAMVRQTAVGDRMLRIWAVPVAGDGGAAVSVEDVTELQRLGRARRDFVANISHELRTPLANIDLAAQTLRNAQAADPALARRMLDQIQSQVQTLSQLSQEMMELAQIESGQVLLKLVETELAAVVQRSVNYLLPQAALKRQTLTLDVPEDLIALIDEQQIGRVINNLVQNAVKFTPEGGTIRVEAEASDEDITVSVRDSGPGIPREEQARVFERFYKADRARSRGGTGLGLAIAKHIVEGHGGRIWVVSTPGQGAVFCFTVLRA